MPNFMLVYHGGSTPESPEEGEKVMAKWMAWLQGMGDALVDGGNPVGQSKTVSSNGIEDHGGANPVSGYSIVKAGSIDAACELAKGCPIHDDTDGSVEVAEIHEM